MNAPSEGAERRLAVYGTLGPGGPNHHAPVFAGGAALHAHDRHHRRDATEKEQHDQQERAGHLAALGGRDFALFGAGRSTHPPRLAPGSGDVQDLGAGPR